MSPLQCCPPVVPLGRACMQPVESGFVRQHTFRGVMVMVMVLNSAYTGPLPRYL